MECDAISEWISAYVDDELEDTEREKVKNHLDSCTACQELADDFRNVSKQLFGIYQNEYPSIALEQRIRFQIESLHAREQSGILAWIVAICTTFMTCLTVATLILSPVGVFTWKAVNVSSRFGHGLYTVLIHMMNGNQGVILDIVGIGVVISIGAFWIMSKLIRKSNLHQFGQIT